MYQAGEGFLSGGQLTTAGTADGGSTDPAGAFGDTSSMAIFAVWGDGTGDDGRAGIVGGSSEADAALTAGGPDASMPAFTGGALEGLHLESPEDCGSGCGSVEVHDHSVESIPAAETWEVGDDGGQTFAQDAMYNGAIDSSIVAEESPGLDEGLGGEDDYFSQLQPGVDVDVSSADVHQQVDHCQGGDLEAEQLYDGNDISDVDSGGEWYDDSAAMYDFDPGFF